MQMRTRLSYNVQFRGVAHFTEDYSGATVQDKYFFIFIATNPSGVLLPHDPNGSQNLWLTYAEIEASGLSIQGGLEVLKMAADDAGALREHAYAVTSY